ncbi:MAG: SDR family oxidoreductase [Saprospiraceae bacterium]|nr:SDR family oxidoreductase [Saprospiraceae bacterium]
MNPFSLSNKTILITGASSGIGRQCAISCSKMGADVILIARNIDNLQQTLKLMNQGNHQYYVQDITEYERLEALIETSCNSAGKISGLIHAAGIELTLPLKVMKAKNYEELFAINTIAGFELARILSKKKYIDEKGGSFVFISSIMSLVANPGLIGYCSSKGAVNAGVRAMALELAPKKIRVNSLSPGYIQTEMLKNAEKKNYNVDINNLEKNFLLGLGKPEDIANACIYLLSDASRWVTGTNLVVDGGYTAR